MENNTMRKMITLKSGDEKEFIVPEAVAVQSWILRHMIEDDCAQNAIPLPQVTALILNMVINYCWQHVDAAPPGISEEERRNWDKQFVDVDLDTLYDLMNAAHHLEIEGLLQLTTQKAADVIKGKTVQEIRQMFNIKNDFTAEEERQIHCEFPWAFE
jgi:S-phase kinase-associated protein 1